MPTYNPSVRGHQHELDFAARIVPGDLDLRRRGQQCRTEAIETRDGPRTPHANRLELGDVMLHRFAIAAGPAGDHELADLEPPRRRRRPETSCHAFDALRRAIGVLTARPIGADNRRGVSKAQAENHACLRTTSRSA